ncbi:RadC-like JAB domain-containing protein [Mucilaginibacter gracilis]|uniref:RadC-like JAB domain-containing protein n=1 Tax=Mucilaginibacter gracilis TaxID=423350 RepID=A0A495J117_9SPHI|nr:JAB domain-containing protein [Mucilaginibacter gracilis]RKR82038.1 RadC-like JAB domain-containing protein [Mucilaginibacter gracilis]
MTASQTASQFKVTEVELVYRNKVHPSERVRINKSEIAYQVLKSTWNENRIGLVEEFKILLLDLRNNCLGISEIASGGMTMVSVDPALIYATALKAKANKIILAHNHPTAHLDPSEADIDLTNKLAQGGEILGLKVVEHIILSSHGYYSMADHGWIP